MGTTVVNFFRNLFCLGLIVASFSGYSQVIIENDEVSSPPIFGEEGNFSQGEQIDTFPALKSVIHFGWLQPIRGRFPFFYEQAFSSHLGASVGLGATYADFFRDSHQDIIFGRTNGSISIGLHAELLLKYYWRGVAIEDYYFGLNTKFSTFNLEEHLDQTYDQQERHYEYVLIAGTQFAEWNQALVYDYYFGIGFSNIFTTNQEFVNINGTFEPITETTNNGFKPIFRIGVKMGIRIK